MSEGRNGPPTQGSLDLGASAHPVDETADPSTPASAATPAAPATLVTGDCLTALTPAVLATPAALVYMDPPFFTQRDFGAFSDVWAWSPEREGELDALRQHPRPGPRRLAACLDGLLSWLGRGPQAAFLVYLGRRLAHLVEVALAPSGSLVVHVDPQASHYLKVLLDALLGAECFLNEIIWHYRRWPIRCRSFQRMHDVLLLYRASPGADEQRTFNTLLRERAPSTQRRWGDQRIQARHDALGRRLPSRNEAAASPGVPMDDVWPLPIIAPSARERTGFPTQKPLRLLERIIEATTDPGELVVDPFCGSGTTLLAAQRLVRPSLGCDLSVEAIAVARARIA